MAGNHGLDLPAIPSNTGSGRRTHVLPIDRTDNGIMRFLWNMPTEILFLTTRSPRFAAF